MNSVAPLVLLTVLTTAVGRSVDFTGRNLTHVPTNAIASDAHTVRLSHNRISRLGSGFSSAPHIRYLLIDDNRVNNLSPQTFQPLRDLLVLDLDRNWVVSLRDFTFSTLAALSDLILSNNLISAVSPRAFHGLAGLQFLELSGNRLAAVPAQAVRLIPSERLSLVALTVNNISRIPGDIASLRPPASYRLQGNPLRCPEDENSSRTDVTYLENRPRWPVMQSYAVTTEGVREFAGKFFFIKRRHEHFGVAPNIFYVPDGHHIILPQVPVHMRLDHFFWVTPRGRHRVPAGKTLTIPSFTAADSGLYTCVRGVPGTNTTGRIDMLLCIDRPAGGGHERETTAAPPPEDSSPPQGGKNGRDACAGSTNQPCCFNGTSSTPFRPDFCDDGSNNSDSQAKPTPLFIAAVIVAMLVLFFPAAVLRWRKRGRSGENAATTAGATLRAGAQAIPLHPLPKPEENASPFAHLRGTELWAAMKLGATQYSLHRVAGAPPADTIGTTEAQVHHYENADADEYASAAPPPLPGDEETAAEPVNTAVSEELPEPSAFESGDTEIGEEDLEMPYGIAAANALYQRGGTVPNTCTSTSDLTNEHTSSADLAEAATYSATDANQTQPSVAGLYRQQNAHVEQIAAEANTLYQHAEGALWHQMCPGSRLQLQGKG
ncbi:PREDICTED: uncharacterized protein LOC109468546 [Branchiostoma belcheri]|uniref:Uncharacterized protein LOC109468546 n=1 Tax=Branchiostoma belcheri TaxID=7741 RepID=A0A6P4YYH1_BRABE|nr:PREDICTED: uncharacterized protein LOC109468546 [Branchiostoma belcheri]